MKDVEYILRNMDFSKLSKIKDILLKKLLTERKLKEIYKKPIIEFGRT